MSAPVDPQGGPTLREILLLLQADVARILRQQDEFITKEVHGLRHAEHEKRITLLEEERKAARRLAMSGVVLPILVALVVWVLTGKA